MQNYQGINGNFTIATAGAGGFSAGALTVVNDSSHGIFPLNILSFAGDTRNDTNLNAGPQGVKNAINWLTWRTPDWIAGGTYTSLFAGTVTWGVTLCVAGGGAIIVGTDGGGGLLKIGDSTHAGNMEVSSTGAVTTDSGSTITVNGALNLNASSVTHFKTSSTVSFDSGSSVTISSPLVHNGGTAVSVLREVAQTSLTVTAGGSGGHFVADAANTFDPSQADVIRSDTSGVTGAHNWTLSPPASGGCVTLLFEPVLSPPNLPNFTITLVDANTSATVTTIPLNTTQAPFRLYYSVLDGQWRKLI